jgi:hypothetical protein
VALGIMTFMIKPKPRCFSQRGSVALKWKLNAGTRSTFAFHLERLGAHRERPGQPPARKPSLSVACALGNMRARDFFLSLVNDCAFVLAFCL